MPLIMPSLLGLQVITTWRSNDRPHPAIIVAIVFTSEAGLGMSLLMIPILDVSSLGITPPGTDDMMDLDDADPMDTAED